MGEPSPRVAILLYGFPRTFEVTAASLERHVAGPLDADIFYFGSGVTDRPGQDHCGVSGFTNAVCGGGKTAGEDGLEAVDAGALARVYGRRLKRVGLRAIDGNVFAAWSAKLDRDEWIFGVDPQRFFAMAHNMAGAFAEMVKFEVETGRRYDVVILTRPDVAFFESISARVRPGRVEAGAGGGFDGRGRANRRGAEVLFYKNAATGEAITSGPRFNDQVLKFARADADALIDLDRHYRASARARVPLQAETLLYHHLVTRRGLELKERPWTYEILRSDQPTVVNATDLDAIAAYDPTNSRARRLIKKHRARTLARNLARVFWRRVIHPLAEIARRERG